MPRQLGCFIKEARSHIEEWDAESAHENLRAGDVLVVDVREADEFEHGHVHGAINIPRGISKARPTPVTYIATRACATPAIKPSCSTASPADARRWRRGC